MAIGWIPHGLRDLLKREIAMALLVFLIVGSMGCIQHLVDLLAAHQVAALLKQFVLPIDAILVLEVPFQHSLFLRGLVSLAADRIAGLAEVISVSKRAVACSFHQTNVAFKFIYSLGAAC